MMNYARHVQRRETPQSQPMLNTKQIKNDAGGYVFEISNWSQYQRFLILGSEGGTYYVSEKEHTIRNADCVQQCMDEDGERAINMLVDVSIHGKALKNDPAIFALAIALSSDNRAIKRAAKKVFNQVVRIGTHLFQFLEFSKALRGWGRTKKEVLTQWYTTKTPDELAYQCIKYQSRLKWSHRDVLRLLHIKPETETHNQLYRYLVGKECVKDELPALIQAHDHAFATNNVKEIISLIKNHGLTHEMVPNDLKNEKALWDALLQKMPMTAMIRNLNKMTQVGLLEQRSKATTQVIERLTDAEYLKKSRIHPIAVLIALKQYAKGKGDKGALTWTPIPRIVDALNEAFYLTFGNVEPMNKAVRLALDVSGSMAWSHVGNLMPLEITSALALITANVEKDYDICMFDNKFSHLDISPKMRLDQVMKKMTDLNFGNTDCSLPMVDALRKKELFDLFVVMTDNETWSGKIHPKQALDQYRQQVNAQARLCVLATTATNCSIADPNDSGMLDIVGFSNDTPQVLSMFGRGEL